MTTANLMNVPSVKGNMLSQADASKKLQEENLEVAEMFAGLMNQTIDIPDSVVDDTSSNMDVSKTNSAQSPVESYERYSYRDKQIETAKEPSVEEKLEEAGEVLEEAGQEVIDTLCEEYGVDEETIQNLLDDMGLSALDLLNPQNLVSFIVQLTGATSGEELLLDENFLKVMEALNHLAEGLMKDLNVDMSGLQELVAEMDLVTNDQEVPADLKEVLENTMDTLNDVENPEKPAETTTATTETTTETVDTKETVVEQNTDETAENQNVEVKTKQEETVEETAESEVEVKAVEQEESSETKVRVEESEETLLKKETEGQSFNGNQNSEGNSFLNHSNHETIVQTQVTSNVSQTVEVPQMTQFSSYLSADSVQIMEQIVQQMRVTISNEITTMEMQMNPENLGKVYVNISSEEGVVNAQFHATNEVVKEALEAQVATLRESLNQAGVKVDAIEVTIASHEFERNLEQNHQNPEEQMNAQETNEKKRRNLNLDSLDELAGVMTEEEALVAQIMRDNGNSVDFTA